MFGHLKKKNFFTSSDAGVIDDLIFKLKHLNLDDNYKISSEDSYEIRSNSDCLKKQINKLPDREYRSTQANDIATSSELVKSLDKEKSKDEQNRNEKEETRKAKRSWTCGHIIEIYDFPKELKIQDLKKIFSSYLPKGLKLRWVDDNHALAILPSSVLANQVLNCELPLVRTRPLAEGTQASKDIARLLVLPQILTLTAKRLVYKNLGLNLTLEELNVENKIIQSIREEKLRCSENKDNSSEMSILSLKSNDNRSSENICNSVVGQNMDFTGSESSSDKCSTSFLDEKLKTAPKNKKKTKASEEVNKTANRNWNRGSILEIYGFPKELKTKDLKNIFSSYLPKGLKLRWVDDTHALAIFPSSVLANEVLSCDLPLVRTRPLAEGTEASKERASLLVLPDTLRPQTCVATARRLVYKNLGLNSPEIKESEREILRKAREIKMLEPIGREAAWKKRSHLDWLFES